MALVLFPLLSLVWVGDALFLGVDLSAFDVIFRLPHWKDAHEYRGVQQIILSDSPQAHYPERALKWRAARDGERVDFNPYIYTGMPELSQGVGAFITSPFQMFMDVSEAIDWSTWFRLAVAGLLMYAFLIVLGITPPAAILGGVIWAFNLHQLAWLEFPQHLATQIWMPALFCFNWVILRRGVSWEALFGILIVNAFFFTSDYIQIVLYTYVAIALFNTVYLAVDTGIPPAVRIRRWLTVHAVFIFSAILLLPKVIVEVQFLDEGLRGTQDWRAQVKDLGWSIEPLIVAAKNMLPDIADYKRFFSPNYVGGLWGERYEGGEFFGNVVVGSTYSGLVVFLTAPVFLLWLRDPDRRPFVAATCVVLLFAFGMIHKDPLLIKAFNTIPMSGLGGYERHITVAVMFLSVMAAVGLHILLRLNARTGQRLFWIVFAVVAASPFWMQVLDPSMVLAKMQYPLAVLGATGAAAAVLCYFKLWRRVAALLIVVTVLDLLVVTYGFNPRMQDHRNFAVTPTLRLLIEDQSTYRVAEVSTRQLYPPNILQFYGIPSLNGYSTVAPRRYVRFIEATLDDYHVTANGQLFFFDANVDVFRLLNTKYVLSEHPLGDHRLHLLREAPGYWVYELTDRLPRAYCADTLLQYESESDLLDDFREIAARYDQPVAVVESEAQPGPLTPNCRVTGIAAHLNGVAFDVSSDESSYVFLPYNYYPHWKAYSEDGAIPVVRANYNFIALPIQAGGHRIRLVYQDPINIVFNVVMIGLGVTVAAWCLARRRRTFTSWLLGFAGLILVLWSLLEIPGIANSDLPERPAPSTVLPDTPS